jgi:hypothetical protein
MFSGFQPAHMPGERMDSLNKPILEGKHYKKSRAASASSRQVPVRALVKACHPTCRSGDRRSKKTRLEFFQPRSI